MARVAARPTHALCTHLHPTALDLHLQTPLVSARSVAWAAAVLLSRGFSLDMAEADQEEGARGGGGMTGWQQSQPDVLALVPWADMLEHSSEAGEAEREACWAAVGTCTGSRVCSAAAWHECKCSARRPWPTPSPAFAIDAHAVALFARQARTLACTGTPTWSAPWRVHTAHMRPASECASA